MDPARRNAIHSAMVRHSNGDRSAFDALLDQLWPVILAFARRGLDNVADAEDIAQETFFKICARISDFDPSRDGLSWAFGIASYEILTQRRQRRRREVAAPAPLSREVDPAASQEDTLLERERVRALERAVSTLGTEDRRVLGLGPETPLLVAGATLRQRKQRALDRLRGIAGLAACLGCLRLGIS